MTDAEQWGPWIDAEDEAALSQVEIGARVEFYALSEDGNILHGYGDYAGPADGGPDCFDAVTLRARKPQGLTILENLIAHIPQREDA